MIETSATAALPGFLALALFSHRHYDAAGSHDPVIKALDTRNAARSAIVILSPGAERQIRAVCSKEFTD